MSGMQFNFNSQQYNPSFGGGGSLPPGQYRVIISESAPGTTKDNQGGFLSLTLKVIDGPLTGGTHIDRLNLHNVNQQAVQIAHERLAGYCVVTGVAAFQNTAELHNKPFGIEIGPQKDNPEYTEVKKLLTVDFQTPVRGATQQAQQPQGGFAQQQPQQGGFTGAPQSPPPPPPPPQGGQPWGGGGQPAGNGAPAGSPWGGAPAGGGQPAQQGGGAPWGR